MTSTKPGGATGAGEVAHETQAQSCDLSPRSEYRRPTYHYSPPSGWVNDPLGLTWHDGVYHLFSQFVPGQTQWSPACRWSHVVGPDLLTWEQQPIALEPGDGDGGCWSGSIARSDTGTVLFYTRVDSDDFTVGSVRSAHPRNDTWTQWDKGEVVVRAPGKASQFTAFRDPCVVREGDRWRMVLGAGLTDGTAVAYSWVSDDLATWASDGELLRRHRDETAGVWTGAVWECPQLIEIDGAWVLLVAVWEPMVPHYTAYTVGQLVDGRFVPGEWRQLTFGPSYYAGSVFRDADGSPGMIYWLREIVDEDAGWAGAHSLPHLLRRVGTRLVADPPETLNDRRTPSRRLTSHLAVGAAFDVIATGGTVRLTEGAEVVFDVTFGLTDVTLTTSAGAWSMPHGDGVVRIVADGPVIELFGARGCLAAPISRRGAGVVEALEAVGILHELV